MNSDVLIKVEGVSKKFCKSLKQSMIYGIKDIARDTLNLQTTSDVLRKDEFWAVDDVSFEVKRGECLGIIGRNGAGKSTLLKMLNGIFMPDKGMITVKGKVGALIEVGAGFHPMLTGRENIYVNGSILGMSKQEIDKKFDEIVAFAELNEFIDMPVKHYSSGMYVRLGFAIAVNLDVDILILDEVLAVGDMAFTSKCLRTISQIKKNTAVILVSHDTRYISRMSQHCLYLKHGKNEYLGGTEETLNIYRSDVDKYSKHNEVKINHETIEIVDVIVNDENNLSLINQFDDLHIKITLNCKFYHDALNLIMTCYRVDGIHCFGILTDNDQINKLDKGIYDIEMVLPNIALMPGRYSFTIRIVEKDTLGGLCIWENVGQFIIAGCEKTQGIYKPDYYCKYIRIVEKC